MWYTRTMVSVPLRASSLPSGENAAARKVSFALGRRFTIFPRGARDDESFADTSRHAASHGQEVAGQRHAQREDPLRHATDAPEELAIRAGPLEHLMIAAAPEGFAIFAEGQRGHGKRPGIFLRRARRFLFWHEVGEGGLRIAHVELRALLDPLFEERDLRGGERVVLLRHAVVFVGGDEALEEQAAVGFARGDRCIAALALLQELLEGVDTVAALGFLLLMAGEALVREDGGEVAGEGDGAAERRKFQITKSKFQRRSSSKLRWSHGDAGLEP